VHILVHNILKNWLFRSLRDGVERATLRLGPDMAVAFHHFLRDVPCDRHDRLVACLPLGQLRDRGVPQVVEAALEAGLLPANPPMYFPTDLWPQTNVILLKARRKFPVQTQALELCKLVTAQMTPLFCEAVRAGKMKAGAVQHESGGGMEDLLRLLLIHNDPGPRSGLGLSDQAYRLGEEVRKSDEWLRLGEAIVEAQGNRAETARPRTENKTQEKSTDRRGMVDGYIAQVLARTGKKISRRDIWLVAGYESATEFERFQRNDQRTTQSAVTNFQRVLDMKPDDFIRLLETRKATKNAQPKKAE
jgi:hypothetical protein